MKNKQLNKDLSSMSRDESEQNIIDSPHRWNPRSEDPVAAGAV